MLGRDKIQSCDAGAPCYLEPKAQGSKPAYGRSRVFILVFPGSSLSSVLVSICLWLVTMAYILLDTSLV